MEEYEYMAGGIIPRYHQAVGPIGWDPGQNESARAARTEAARLRAEGAKRAGRLLEACLGEAQSASCRTLGYFEVTGSLGGRWRISTAGMSGNVTLITASQSFTYCGYPRPDGGRDLPQADVMLAQALHLITDEGHFRRTAYHEWIRPGCGFDGCPMCSAGRA